MPSRCWRPDNPVADMKAAGTKVVAFDATTIAQGLGDIRLGNTVMLGAIADHLVEDLKDNGFGTAAIEGQPACDWVLVDTGDVIVHVFRPEVRQFYNLEKMWAADPVAPLRRS
jgi:ribosome silencing factor RsfS/YbeB/iojap